MDKLTIEQKKTHHKAVVACLPASLKRKCPGRFWMERQYSSRPYYMKVKFPWEYNEKIKCFRIHKDGVFSYRKIADHIAEVVAEHAALCKRRESGERSAEKRIAGLEEAFRSNSLLSALNLEIISSPTHQTETGSVDVDVSAEGTTDQEYLSVSTAFDGQAFSGDITFDGVSMEQFVAMMVVLRAGQLNLLEMISLADDSILGPIIHKLTEDQGGKTKHE